MGSFLSPAPESLSSAPGRAVPSSQARELGAVICVSVRGGGRMQFVKDPQRNPARAGLLEPQEPPGHTSLPSLPVPRMAAQGSKQGVGTPLLPLAPPRAGEAGWDRPIRHKGVLSPAPCHPGALGVALVPHGAPQHCHPCTGDTVQVSQSGGGHCAGVTATPAQGGQCQGYSNGLTATPVWESAVPGSLSHLCWGTMTGSLSHLHRENTEPRPLRHHSCAGGQ